MKTILTLAANPDDTSALRLNREIREIETRLQQSKYRDEFTFIRRDAVRWDDLQRAILEIKPRIIHFCGHGTGQSGLVLENDQGQCCILSTDILSDLFKQVAPHVECVLLNACHSKEQALAISQHINYVIGMNQAIADADAIAYAQGFYLALGAGESIQGAHATGCRQIQSHYCGYTDSRDLSAHGDAEPAVAVLSNAHTIPELYVKETLTVFADPAQEPKLREASNDAHAGLTALVELLANPKIYEAVIVFRSDFKVLAEQIQLLSYYKNLHDLLHKVEIECYRNIVQEARRFPTDDMALTMLAEYGMALQGITAEVCKVVATRPEKAYDAPWIHKLEDAHTKLQAATDNVDVHSLQQAIFSLTQLLADQPVRLNTSLTETAKALRLAEMVNNLGTLQPQIYAAVSDSAKVQQFSEGISSLSSLSTRLEVLVHTHDAWQEVDSILRRIEVNLHRDTTDLEWAWPGLKELTKPLYQDVSDPMLLSQKQCEQRLDDAIALNDPVKIKHHFCIYRRAALNYFSQVDLSLIQLCDELRDISQSLALVVEKIS
ncbi:CHAT domain-containing protein [Leptolyngbya sp. AN02str]|uniref:CHAT domain-containing protein n=1 Tax=Leptolyngbya sp. AN02str TaxID=3423363 RepID=UPI003D322244